jgi:hypothetical protein
LRRRAPNSTLSGKSKDYACWPIGFTAGAGWRRWWICGAPGPPSATRICKSARGKVRSVRGCVGMLSFGQIGALSAIRARHVVVRTGAVALSCGRPRIGLLSGSCVGALEAREKPLDLHPILGSTPRSPVLFASPRSRAGQIGDEAEIFWSSVENPHFNSASEFDNRFIHRRAHSQTLRLRRYEAI